MGVDVVKVQGDYQIIAAPGGQIVLDVNTGTRSATTGTVIIKGNLVVFGSQSSIETIDSKIKDNTITLNAGEPTSNPNGEVTAAGGKSGIKISRGRAGLDQDQYAAFLEWNDTARWTGEGAIGQITGLWEFRVGKTGRPQYSGIKINAIRIDENSASTGGAGAGQGPRLSLFGTENPTAVLSVKGTNNYESRVTDDDDIPNKKYVDDVYAANFDTAKDLVRGNTWFKLIDQSTDGVTSEIVGVLDGDPTERLDVTTGTTVLRLTKNVAQLGEIQIVGTEIMPQGVDNNLKLSASGDGQIIVAAPLLFENSGTPIPGTGQTGLYSDTPGGGGTGIYFVTSSTLGVVTTDEFVSRKRALIFSLIF